MSILSWLENAITVTEQDIIAIVTKVKQGIELASHEVDAFFSWVATETPNIIAFTQQVQTVAAAAGALIPGVAPEAAAVVGAANIEIAALNKFAAVYNSGGGNAASVVAAYGAITSARAAANKAMSVVVSAPVAPATPAVAQSASTS